MDATDEAIVDLLKQDGRLSHREIARLSGLSRAVVASSMQRLLESGGVIVRGVVHPAVLGRGSLAHVGVIIDGRAAPIAARIADLTDVPFVSLVAGRYAIVAEVRAGSPEQIDATIGRLRTLDGVRAVDSLPYLEVVRDVVGPTGHVTHVVDAVDITLLRALQEDGRASYVDLAQLVGLSPAGTRRRVVRLLDNQVIKIGVLMRQSGEDRQMALGLGIRLAGSHEQVTQTLQELPAVAFLARTLGRFDYVATLRSFTPARLTETLEMIRSLPGVSHVESWSHLRFAKETYASPGIGADPGGSARD